ncbi:MAG TPA: hypothetical protein VD927_11310 [Chryseosolibacter sp.]|nr:hypothetical protein [Chryseosolibacter sp.]
MLKDLVEKRNGLFAEYEKFKQKLVAEKRAAYTNDELTAVNNIKQQIDEIDNTITAEKEIEAKRNIKLDNLSKDQNVDKKDNILVTEFRSFLNGQGANSEFVSNGKFNISFDAVKRSTITSTSNAGFVYAQQAGLSIADNNELVLPKLGVQTSYFESGEVDHPSMASIVATFEDDQDTTINDQTLTSASKKLKPVFVSASLEVSKAWVAASKPENIQALIGELKFAVDKALEKRTIDSFSTLTAIVSGATGVTTSFHNVALQMEKEFNGVPSGYIFSKSGVAKAKQAKIDSGSGQLVMKDGVINGYPAVRSSLMTNENHGYLINAKAVAQAYWGAGIEIETVTDSTLARKGNILLVVSAHADGSYIDANGVALIKNVDKLT